MSAQQSLGPQWSSDEISEVANVFSRAPDDPDPLAHDPHYDWQGLAEAVKRGDVSPTVKVRASRFSWTKPEDRTAFQVDDGTHRLHAARAGLIPNAFNVEFIKDSDQRPAEGSLLSFAQRDWNDRRK